MLEIQYLHTSAAGLSFVIESMLRRICISKTDAEQVKTSREENHETFGCRQENGDGASDEDNRKNKARMREIFNSLVSDGDDYKLGPFARKSRLRDASQY